MACFSACMLVVKTSTDDVIFYGTHVEMEVENEVSNYSSNSRIEIDMEYVQYLIGNPLFNF